MDDQNPGFETAKVFKWTEEGLIEQDRPIIREVPLTIYLNDHEIVTLLCLGDHLKSLAVGFLKSEGLINRVDDLKSVFVDETNRLVRVEMEEELKRNYQIQSLLSSMLGVSFTSMTLDEQMDEILAEKYGKSHLGTYYQALVQKELKNTGAYQSLLAALEKQAREYSSGKSDYRNRRAGAGHYLLSLVLAEKGEKENAAAELNTALSQNAMARRAAVLQAQLDVARAHQ